MNERKEEDSDENGFDPTKDAFFSDLMGMEEEVASEAYELVEHAIHLTETKYFDDSIEILRQAIGLYSQINRVDEIKAINEKISEIYLLKEELFRESEGKSEKHEVEEEDVKISDVEKDSTLEPELIQKEIEVDPKIQAEQLVREGKELLETNNFEETLNKYDQAVEILEEAKNSEEIERIFELIEVCYKKKAEFLRNVKKIPLSAEVEKEEEQKELTEVELKEEKLKQYLISKKKEEEISSHAYEVLGKAAQLASTKQYDKALQLYEEGAKYFQDLNWTYEVKKVQDTIIQLENEKLVFLKRFDEQRIKREEKLQSQTEEVETIGQKEMDLEEQEKLAKLERLKAIENQKMETDFFKSQIDNMATEALRMAREYELSMQKAIKKGDLVEDCIYPQVIKAYEKIKELLIDKGWNSEAAIYDDTIQVYHQKLKQDNKIRQIETEKVLRQLKSEEFIKLKKENEIPAPPESQVQVSEEQHRREIEEQKFRTNIDEITIRAERLAREYEVALRKGKFELKCPYPEIIKIYNTAMQKSQERGWETDVAIFSSQILAFTEKLEKDKRLRQIEAEKILKQKEMGEILKIQKDGKLSGLEEAKLSISKVKTDKEVEDQEFEQLINDMVKKAELLAREYDLAMKKAVRQGKLADNPPFAEIIKIYERVRQMVVSKERNEEAAAYKNQINYYSQKLQKDKNLREIEVKKAERRKEIKDMHKVDRKVGIDEEKLSTTDRKKEEEVEFERYITNNIDNAEKLVREYEISMRKAMRKGEILENTPYSEVIDIYKDILEKVYAKGWKEQTEVYTNQIKIYQKKLDKHVKLLEIEAKKVEKQKEIDEMHKADQKVEVDEEKLSAIERKKVEEEDFERNITNMIDEAEKLVRDYEISMRKAMRKGEILENTPYSTVIDMYKEIREKVYARGWKTQAEVYANQIKIYQEKLDKHVKLHKVEAKKVDRQRDIDEMHRVREELKPEKVNETVGEIKEEDILLDNAMNLIDEAERSVKNYELSIKTDVLLYESPYEKAIENYQEAKKLFQKIGWNEEASRLVNTIKFYKKKNEKDENLRQLEKKKLEELTIEKVLVKDDTKKGNFAREKRILEFEKQKKEKSEAAEKIFNEIQKAEKMAQEYEIKKKEIIFDHKAPYDEILKIYREARKNLEEIGWIEESMHIVNTIGFYKEKFEKDKRLRALEIAKGEKRDEELLQQQTLLKQAKKEQETLLKRRKESRFLQEEKVNTFETAKDKAFILMDKAKVELNSNNFENAIQFYKESEEIFSEISWQEGVNMVIDSIAMIKRRKKSFEFEQANIEKERLEKLNIESKLEEKFAKAEELRKLQQEEKRKEFLKIQSEKQWEREISEEAYKLLEQGTSLLERKKFEEANEKYIEARKLFDKISWKREVSRINNELLFVLKREKKIHEVLGDIKKKKEEEEKQMEKLKKETERERRELKKQKKDDKRKLAREEFDKKIFRELERAKRFINDFKYNEGILLMIREKKKLRKLVNDEEIKRIEEIINDVKDKAEIPLVTFEPLGNIGNLEKFETTYKALDKAQVSLENDQLMKAVSELNEAKANLKVLKMGKKYISDIDKKIRELQERLGKKSPKEDFEAKEKEHDAEMDRLKARIAARREERRKKVLDLLKKD